jgi:hypothetical protein
MVLNIQSGTENLLRYFFQSMKMRPGLHKKISPIRKDDLVGNMASYAICSSLILVIHNNMTNVTNHIVEHVFVDISRPQGCKNTTCQNGEKEKEKEKRAPSNEPTVPLEEAPVQATDEVEHCVKTQDNWHRTIG